MMKKILVIEDEELVRENLIELLEAEEFEAIAAENGCIGIDLAKIHVPDLILCDVMMPQLDGYGVLVELRQDPILASIPFIFLTAKAAKTDLRQGMELGADDYITKPFTRAELLGAIASRLRKQAAMRERYHSELQQTKEQLNYLIRHDSLTGLPNRLSLREKFNQIQTENGQFIPVFCLGLDRFGQINEDLGHDFGDVLLKAIAQRLVRCAHPQDTVARLSTDQFALILAKSSQESEVEQIAQTLLEQLSQAFFLMGHEIFVTASLGIALSPRDGTEIEALLAQAGVAMLQGKRQGGDRYQIYTPSSHTSSSDRLAIQAGLRHALERDELSVHYQPQVNLQTGEIFGAEALVRWQHPERGSISPAKFIPIAEETGLIGAIGEWVLQTACQQTRRWQQAGFAGLRIAVNLSSRQFKQPDLRQRLMRILAETGLNAQWLELELTESMLVQNTDEAIRQLRDLKALGVEIAIDDFGTGYSSLSYLQQFPFDVLKIDRCFIQNVKSDANKAAITQAIVQMAKSLNLKSIAEGVETEAELSFVQQQQCHAIQGYFFSAPVPAEAFQQLLATGKRLPLPVG